MRQLLVVLAFCGSIAAAQNVIDVQNVTAAAQATLTTLQAITGADGTTCALSKVPGNSIYAWFACAQGKQTLKTVAIQSTSAAAGTVLLGQGQVLCIVAVNPTGAAVTFGSVGSAPAKGLAWQCGNGDGAALLAGSVVWP